MIRQRYASGANFRVFTFSDKNLPALSKNLCNSSQIANVIIFGLDNSIETAMDLFDSYQKHNCNIGSDRCALLVIEPHSAVFDGSRNICHNMSPFGAPGAKTSNTQTNH